MHEYENAADDADAEPDATAPGSGGATGDSDGPQGRIVVAVVRTGGIAGLRRRWRAEPAPEQAPSWLGLVQRCPWDERLEPDGSGADRYVWSIHARIRDEQLEQVIPDTRLDGAWRELVDAVREADSHHDEQ